LQTCPVPAADRPRLTVCVAFGSSLQNAVTVVRCSSREAEDEVKEAARLTMTETDAAFSETGHTWQKRFAGLPAYAPDGRDSEYPLLEAVPEGYIAPLS